MADGATRGVAEGVARLKELLFDNESQALTELETRIRSLEGLSESEKLERVQMLRRIEQVFERAGTEERFTGSVAVVLDRALQEAELRNHDEMARALAPLVLQTIKTELKNSQDEMVEILYPITGRLVKSYIASAMKDLTDQINRRIDQNPLMLRLQSLTTGKSVAELAIAESQRLQVEEVYLIRRGSGELLARWPDAGGLSNADVHMSGVLAAINEFATNAFAEEGGSFRTLEVDDFHVYLRASPVYLLAAKCHGIAPGGIETIFDEEFLATLERLADLEKRSNEPPPRERVEQLQPLASAVEGRATQIYEENARSGLGGMMLKLALFCIAVPLLAWIFWGLYTDAEEAIAQSRAQAVIDKTSELDGYPVSLDVGYRGRSIKVSGLAPEPAVSQKLTDDLKEVLPGSSVESKLAVVPSGNIDTRPIVASVEKRLSDHQAKQLAEGLRRSLARAQAQLTAALPEFDRLERALQDPAQKVDVRETRGGAEASLREVEAFRQRTGTSGPIDKEILDALSGPINKTASDVKGAIINVGGIIGSNRSAKAPEVEAQGDISLAAETLAAQSQRLATLLTTINQAAALVPPPAPPVEASKTPSERLEAFATRNAVFFSNGTDFANPDRARKVLDDLASLMKQTDDLIRVVGYTDVRGGQTQNNTLSQNRADAVASELRQRGVPGSRIVSVGRTLGLDLSPSVGVLSPNRRVQFEIGFKGEARGGEASQAR